MAIVLTRVDGRLIHGQVAVAWTRNVNAEKIIVIDDETAKDEMQKTLVRLAAPSGVSVQIYSVEEGVDVVKSMSSNRTRTMLIVKYPETILTLINQGISIHSVNIGGMYYEEGKEKISKALFVDENDRKIFQKLNNTGVELYYQVAPLTKKEDLFSLLD